MYAKLLKWRKTLLMGTGCNGLDAYSISPQFGVSLRSEA
jgi:hypothetical protein